MTSDGPTAGMTRYLGDDELRRLLGRAGCGMSIDEIRALIRGVLAAPDGTDADAWLDLVTPRPQPVLAAQLQALKREMRPVRPGPRPPGATVERVAALRAELKRRRLDGFIVPKSDEHQGEWVPAGSERLAWLTGFTGSAGFAIVLPDDAALFVDGRYTLQAAGQVDGRVFIHRHVTEEPATLWIAATLRPGQALGYDSWLHTAAEISRLSQAAARAGARLEAVAGNPVDAIWTDRPTAPLAPVVAHPLRYAGAGSAEKRRDIASILEHERIDAAVLTAPDVIAWLLNIRGGDVGYAPLPLSFAILHRDATVDLFIDRRKLTPGLGEHLGNAVSIRAPEDFATALGALAGKAVRIDPATTAAWISDRLAGARVVEATDPCAVPRACKTATEMDGARAAHRRDGAALTRFLAWLGTAAASGTLREIEVSDRLEAERRKGESFRGLSFATISAAGANGAITHYCATPETERVLERGTLYLVDSGAQYLDGTTDVTRTVAIGEPSAEMKDRFTRVLKGHIALATARFPKGTTGAQLDALARRPLWEAGLDFDHGTGHGVGSYLSVHEGPHRISRVPNAQPLLPGMVVSNEPGYYKAGAYGIRIENLVAVVPLSVPGAEREMYGFETLTLAPIDRRCMTLELMTTDEIAWVDAYHERVRAAHRPAVEPVTGAWLDAATAPLR